MHPLLHSWRASLAYCAAWIPLGGILVLVTAVSGNIRRTEAAAILIGPLILLALLCLLPFYICSSLPLRSTAAWRVAIKQTAAALIVSSAVVLAARFFAAAAPLASERFAASVPVLATLALMIYLLSVAMHYAVLEVETSRRAELLTREAELRALKSQVNPHFLFNSLNSISALTSVDPERARQMCVFLGDFLRASLRLGERVTVPFGEELSLMNMYLAVEHVRFGGRLRVAQAVDPDCEACEIPALLVQPLVENAVKHGIAMLSEGGEISLSARREHDCLLFTISNPFDPEAPSDRKNGIGLRNVRDRLETRYGAAAQMKVEVEPQAYRVTLILPVEARR